MTVFAEKSFDSSAYEAYRPDYGEAFYDRLYEYHRGHGGEFKVALDVATGTGKVAAKLAEDFETVYAADVSTVMMAVGQQRQNLHYIVAAAEDLSAIPSDSIDLVTVAQALHWLDHPKFFLEVQRILKSTGTFAAVGYGGLVFKDSLEMSRRLEEIYFSDHGMAKYRDLRLELLRNLFEDIDVPLKNVERTYYARDKDASSESKPLIMEAKRTLNIIKQTVYTSSVFVNCVKEKGETFARKMVDDNVEELRQVKPHLKYDQELDVTWSCVTIFAQKGDD